MNESGSDRPEYRVSSELDALSTFVEHFTNTHHIPFDELLSLLKERHDRKKPTLIPSYIFYGKKLGILESVVKYLREEFKLTYHQIAVLLQRDDRVIWVTYNRASKKQKEPFFIEDPNVWLPVSLFTIKTLGPLQSIVVYLKDHSKLSFNEIAKLLNRDNRTVWAVYHRKRKEGTEGETQKRLTDV